VLSIGGWGAVEYAHEGDPTYYFVDTVKVPLPPAQDANRHGRLLSLEEFVGYRVDHHFRTDWLIAAMLVPVILLWAIAYVCVLIVRWVAVGFKKNGT
jgi:hypothetical protein